jgi:hypothetical protein
VSPCRCNVILSQFAALNGVDDQAVAYGPGNEVPRAQAAITDQADIYGK